MSGMNVVMTSVSSSSSSPASACFRFNHSPSKGRMDPFSEDRRSDTAGNQNLIFSAWLSLVHCLCESLETVDDIVFPPCLPWPHGQNRSRRMSLVDFCVPSVLDVGSRLRPWDDGR